MAEDNRRLRVACIGSGISGLSAAWLLHRLFHTLIFTNIKRASTHQARTACLFAAQLGPGLAAQALTDDPSPEGACPL